MPLLLIAALAWIALHLLVSGTRLRDRLVALAGPAGFQAGFAIASVAGLAWLILAWRAAETTLLWFAPEGLRWVLVLAMLPAFFLFVAAVTTRNPTAVGGDGAMGSPATGILRITRHPMLWSFALWGLVHVLGNGDGAALVFFGTILVTALAGMPSIDAKLARRTGPAWQGFAARTSILPFGAILAGRNRLVLREIGWWRPVLALVVWAAVFHAHGMLFGVTPLLGGG